MEENNKQRPFYWFYLPFIIGIFIISIILINFPFKNEIEKTIEKVKNQEIILELSKEEAMNIITNISILLNDISETLQNLKNDDFVYIEDKENFFVHYALFNQYLNDLEYSNNKLDFLLNTYSELGYFVGILNNTDFKNDNPKITEISDLYFNTFKKFNFKGTNDNEY